jgi:hypothetical protein
MEQGSYRHRTRRNVQASDGTLIIYRDRLSGGSRLTLEFCFAEHKPFKLIDAAEVSAPRAAELVEAFVEEERIGVLNVAGPRESGWPGACVYATEVIRSCLESLS